MSSPAPDLPEDRRALWRALGVASVLAVVFVAVLWPRIAVGTLWHNDELLAGNRAREMVLRHDPLTVTVNFTPDFKKPPLQYWFDALLLATNPNRELAIRLPALIYGALCLPATVFLAWAATRRANANTWSLLVPALAVAAFGSFVHFARIGLLDTGSAFYLALALAGCLLARANPRWWWLVGVCCWLGAWQKGPYALAAWLLIIALRRIREPDAQDLRSRQLWGAFGLSLALTSAWFVFQFVRHGDDVVLNAGQEQAGALLRAHDPDSAGFRPYLYWWWLTRDWALIGFLAPVAVVAATIRGWRSPGNSPLLELAAVSAAFGLVIALTPFRVERYLIAIVPLLAVVTMRWADDLLDRRGFSHIGQRVVMVLLLASAFPVAGFHYLKPARGGPDTLLSATHALHDSLQPGDIVVIEHDPEPDFNFYSFILFYADLRQPVKSLRINEIRWVLSADRKKGGQQTFRGIERAELMPQLVRADPDLQILARYDEWVLWRHGR